MADDNLSLREKARADMGDDVTGWKAKFEQLRGIADAIMGMGYRKRSQNEVMAKKLCSYYMRNEGYTWRKIAEVIGLTTHDCALKHANTCNEFLSDTHGDKCYRLAHKKAQELGIAK
jgi:hypothetical protein